MLNLNKITSINFIFYILFAFISSFQSELTAKELVIVIDVDRDVIKTSILPVSKKETVIQNMSNPSHLTVMWLKDLPNGHDPKVSLLQQRLTARTTQFLDNYKSSHHENDFKIVVDRIEEGPGGIYLLPTDYGNGILTNLIMELKDEVNSWKSENPEIPVNYYKYFSGNHFMPHITVLETTKTNKIFPGYGEKQAYGNQIKEHINHNKPNGYSGIPIPILHTDSWFQ
ncbi:MAG TPA: hypothetical protein VMW10_04555 [Alphaproteobacteria bacterium]|nr:hypothetical protein [Alphaproteobacteria bacterium]